MTAAFLLSPAPTWADAAKLDLAAIAVSPPEAETIAIHDPGDAPVDLTNYYLADTDTYTAS